MRSSTLLLCVALAGCAPAIYRDVPAVHRTAGDIRFSVQLTRDEHGQLAAWVAPDQFYSPATYKLRPHAIEAARQASGCPNDVQIVDVAELTEVASFDIRMRCPTTSSD